MRLICLNTWSGKVFEPLINFIKQYSKEVDIFCFQEVLSTSSGIEQYKWIRDNFILVRANLLQEMADVLPDFQWFYFPILDRSNIDVRLLNFDLNYGQAIFVRNSIKVNSQNNYLLYRGDETPIKDDWSNLPIGMQDLDFNLDGKDFNILNFHGTPYPSSKLDTEFRVSQSIKIKEILQNKKGAKILVGDFNLLPETQSIRILEDGMRNLIKDFNVKDTRGNLHLFEGKIGNQKFADYIFVTKDVEVENFQALDVEVSDHLPLLLEFS